MKLNLGCRLDIRDGYDNIDIAPLDPRVIAGDIRSLTYDPGSVEEIIAQDVLEHIYPSESAAAIRHWFSLLAKGGTLTVRVPDIFKQCQLVVSGQWDSRAFSWMVFAGTGTGERHCTGFTMDRLTGLIEGAGFTIDKTEYEQDKISIDASTSSNVNIVVHAHKP